jgi:uridine kinase
MTLVVIEVRGGVVQEVHLPPRASSLIVDWDNIDAMDLDALEAQISELDDAINTYPLGDGARPPLEELVHQLRCERTDKYIAAGMTTEGDA